MASKENTVESLLESKNVVLETELNKRTIDQISKAFLDDLNVFANVIRSYISGHKIQGIDDNLFQLGLVILNNFNPNQVIETFIDRSIEHWKAIRNKEHNLLLQDLDILLQGVPKDKILLISKLFTIDENGELVYLTTEQYERLWTLFQKFVIYGINYIYIKRCPQFDEKQNKYIFTQTCMPNVSVKNLCIMYELDDICKKHNWK